MWQDYFQVLLNQKYKHSKLINKSYSLRAFADKLEISSGDISELMTGKRRISKKRALKISNKIALTKAEEITLSELFQNDKSLPRQKISLDQNFMEQSHIYIPLMCLLELDELPDSLENMAKALNLTPEELEDALRVLESKGLIHKINQVYKMSQKSLITTEDIPDKVYNTALQKDFESMITALNDVPVHARECTSITFAGSSENLEDLKKEIRTFRDRISILSSKNSKNEVYRLTIGLIPVLQRNAKETTNE
jgi:transcriptional regulator with XRE-family HTH domain/DNA-binding Lrp family transcriptional regulator